MQAVSVAVVDEASSRMMARLGISQTGREGDHFLLPRALPSLSETADAKEVRMDRQAFAGILLLGEKEDLRTALDLQEESTRRSHTSRDSPLHPSSITSGEQG
jgi:hypothetical protein